MLAEDTKIAKGDSKKWMENRTRTSKMEIRGKGLRSVVDTSRLLLMMMMNPTHLIKTDRKLK